ncbi:MAG: condensation domain-containing protein [Oscillatoriaceae cyanobacterium Prado104]|nr:condensation domain-containing protein [Oscillatoriaceae cyanobacterium Prado104]
MQTTSNRSSVQALSQDKTLEARDQQPSNFWLNVRNNVRLQNQAPPIQHVSRDRNLSLSFNQERLWFLEQLQPGTSVHNILHCFKLTGLLNTAALEQSLAEIARRHEILRTTFSIVDGQPIQVISPKIDLQLPLIDLQELPGQQRELQAQKLAVEDAEQPFDLEKIPLWRIKLLRLAEAEYVLIRTVHHMIFDGWSHSVFLRELGVLYEAYSTQQPSPLTELSVQYADFAHTQRQWLQGEILSSQLDYWKQQLSGNVPALELPLDYPRPTSPSYRGGCQSIELSELLTDALKKLSYQQGVSLFVTLLTAFNTLLYQYTEQEDMLVCSPVAGRHRADSKKLIGYFNNVVVLRADLSGNPSFRELLSRVSQVSSGANFYQDFPLQKIAELPNLARTPLTRAMFVLHNTPNQSLELAGLTVSALYVEREIANFDLSLSVQEKEGKITGALQYKTDLFEATNIAQMLENFQTLLESVVTDPELSLQDLPRLGAGKYLQKSRSQEDLTSVAPQQTSNFVAPAEGDDLAVQLTYLWEQVLGIHPIGMRDNFFALGGYSLLAVRLCEQIEQTFNIELPLATIFQAPTIEEQANILSQKPGNRGYSSLAKIQPKGAKPPLFLCEGVGIYYPLIPHLGAEQPIYGLVAGGGLGKEILWDTVEQLASHYIEEILTIQPEGPYFLGGLSWGGIVAFEMAQQLLAQNREVGLLVFLDTILPGASTPKPFHERLLYHWNQILKHRHNYVLEKLDSKIEKLKNRLAIHGFHQQKKDASSQDDRKSPNARLKHIATRQAFSEICKKYTPQVYPGRVAIFSASDREDAATSNVPLELGWDSLVSGSMEIYHVSGDHLSILKEPLVGALGAKLKDALERAQAQSSQDRKIIS